jgi:hypothetical protein
MSIANGIAAKCMYSRSEVVWQDNVTFSKTRRKL